MKFIDFLQTFIIISYSKNLVEGKSYTLFFYNSDGYDQTFLTIGTPPQIMSAKFDFILSDMVVLGK